MSRGSDTSHIKEPTRGTGQVKQPIKRVDWIPIKEKTFTAEPAELEEQLEFPEEIHESLSDPDDLLETDNIDYELSDEDDFSSDKLASELEHVEAVLPGAEPELADSPEISPERVYQLIVTPADNDKFFCEFAPLQWMYGQQKADGKRYSYILRDFLLVLASWLEKHKQDFLRDPTPENFVKNENCRPDNCIVLQSHLLRQINKLLPKNGKMTQSYLSRLHDKIWLSSPEWSMPLSTLLTKPYDQDFKKAWVLEGSLEHYRNNPEFRSSLRYKFFKKDYMEYKNKPFTGLDPEERLYVLSCTVGLASQMEELFQEIKKLCEDSHA